MEQSKFSTDWASAVDIAHSLDLPAIAVNKTLEDEGLLQASTMEPTERAVAEGWVTVVPPEEGGQRFIWSVPKAVALLQRTRSPLSKAEIAFESFVCEILRLEQKAREAEEGEQLARLYINEELPRYRGTSAEVVAAVCQRLGIASRVDEFVSLVAPAETSRTAGTLTGDPGEARGK